MQSLPPLPPPLSLPSPQDKGVLRTLRKICHFLPVLLPSSLPSGARVGGGMDAWLPSESSHGSNSTPRGYPRVREKIDQIDLHTHTYTHKVGTVFILSNGCLLSLNLRVMNTKLIQRVGCMMDLMSHIPQQNRSRQTHTHT